MDQLNLASCRIRFIIDTGLTLFGQFELRKSRPEANLNAQGFASVNYVDDSIGHQRLVEAFQIAPAGGGVQIFFCGPRSFADFNLWPPSWQWCRKDASSPLPGIFRAMIVVFWLSPAW